MRITVYRPLHSIAESPVTFSGKGCHHLPKRVSISIGILTESYEKTENMKSATIVNSNDKDSDMTEETIEGKKILIGEDDPGDVPVDPVDGQMEGDYVDYNNPRYRIHPITGDIMDSETGEIIKSSNE